MTFVPTQFMLSILQSLSRLGLPTNSGSEYRCLAVDLAATVIRWEERRIAEAANPQVRL